MQTTSTDTQSTPRLSEFLRARHQEIVEAWLQDVRSVSPAHDLPAPALIDHLPAILARVATVMERGPEGSPADLETMPESHAIDRLGRGFDLKDVVGEYSLLRRCILELWAGEFGDLIHLDDLRRLDAAIEHSIAQSIVEYATARERLLRAVDRIADAAMGSADVVTFLHHLLRVTVEMANAVDTGAVLLREGDLLRVRAATGLEREEELGFALKVGEGFAGAIAADGKPRELTAAAADPLVKSEILKEKGIKALYGVPLIHNGEVVGVAHMGSASAREFSDEDKLLFRTMANRATAVIIQAELVERERKAHRELQETHARLLQVTASERRARADLEQVLAVVSHDLKNPISVIHMTAQMLRRAAPAPPTQRHLEAIERSLGRANRLIADLLDMGSIQSGRLAVEVVPQGVDELVAETIQLHEPLALEKGVRLAASAGQAGQRVQADRGRIQQVFGNLVGNALRFSESGSDITVGAAAEGGEVIFSVADRGPGIAPDDLSRIFDPYWSGERHGQKSTGLGLSIARGIVEAHGGRIWVESAEGRGSTFYFSLPRALDG